VISSYVADFDSVPSLRLVDSYLNMLYNPGVLDLNLEVSDRGLQLTAQRVQIPNKPRRYRKIRNNILNFMKGMDGLLPMSSGHLILVIIMVKSLSPVPFN
jgi:hypothetical protein